MQSRQVNNKRIAKNTIILYIRTLFVMLISLYTSRVILKALGIDDYGIYQVVGGIVTVFSVISTSLTAAISRFITFEIGCGNKERIKQVFSTSITIQIVLSLIIFVLTEIIGVWFMETEMQIPLERLNAARWVLHCSVLTFCVNLLSVPYNACIIAHERMNAFAYIGIFEAVMKLLICYLIIISPIDKLVSYSLLILFLALVTRLIYTFYTRKNFEESRGKLTFNRAIFKEMAGFSGWSFFNNTTYILNNQGVNMLMNIYFGVAVNAARGIAVQVENAVLQFVNNFTTAINPQITKSYAAGDLQSVHKLVCRGAKYSYYSMLIISLPIIIEAEQILNIWLVEVPQYTVIFVQLSLILGMCDSLGNSGYTACVATGKIRKYSIVLTSIGVLEFPLAWLVFAIGALPEYSYYTYVVVKISVLVARMFLMREMISLKVSVYIKDVFVPIILTTIVAIVPPMLFANNFEQNVYRIIFTIIISLLSTFIAVVSLGMTKVERNAIVNTLVKKIIKR